MSEKSAKIEERLLDNIGQTPIGFLGHLYGRQAKFLQNQGHLVKVGRLKKNMKRDLDEGLFAVIKV